MYQEFVIWIVDSKIDEYEISIVGYNIYNKVMFSKQSEKKKQRPTFCYLIFIRYMGSGYIASDLLCPCHVMYNSFFYSLWVHIIFVKC